MTSPLGGVDQVDQRRLSLFPPTGLQTAVWVDEQQRLLKVYQHVSQAFLDLFTSGDTRGVNVVDTGTNLVGISVVLEGFQQLHVALRRLDGNDIGIQALDGRENVVKVGVTEVGVGLSGISDPGCCETEGINGPSEVMIPISTTKRQLKTNSRQFFAICQSDAAHVHLHG